MLDSPLLPIINYLIDIHSWLSHMDLMNDPGKLGQYRATEDLNSLRSSDAYMGQ